MPIRVPILAALAMLITVPAARAAITLTDPDHEVQVVLSDGWRPVDVGPLVRRIVAFHPQFDARLTVVHVHKEDTPVKDLKGYADVTFRIDANQGKIRNSSVVGPKSLTINGRPALQYEQSCLIGETKTLILRTYIEMEGSWNMILCWSPQSKAAGCRPIFDRIIDSFGVAGEKRKSAGGTHEI